MYQMWLFKKRDWFDTVCCNCRPFLPHSVTVSQLKQDFSTYVFCVLTSWGLQVYVPIDHIHDNAPDIEENNTIALPILLKNTIKNVFTKTRYVKRQ